MLLYSREGFPLILRLCLFPYGENTEKHFQTYKNTLNSIYKKAKAQRAKYAGFSRLGEVFWGKTDRMMLHYQSLRWKIRKWVEHVTFELLSKTKKVCTHKQTRLHYLLLRMSRCQVNFAVNTAAQVLGDGGSGVTPSKQNKFHLHLLLKRPQRPTKTVCPKHLPFAIQCLSVFKALKKWQHIRVSIGVKK